MCSTPTEAVTRFDREQTKLMHLIVVRDDFTGNQHLHPVLHAGGRFTLPVTLPAPGRYRGRRWTAIP